MRAPKLAIVAFLTALVAWTAEPAVAEFPPDPPHNLAMGELPRVCNSAHGATGVTCENAVIYYLDKARSAMGLEPYRLPADFPALTPDRQIFILSNLDILSYRSPAVAGLNSDLSAAAAQGVTDGGDPNPPAGYQYSGFTSNWAGGYTNALVAYYEWMYDDGLGSTNLDCKQAGDGGCWGHRHDIVGYYVYAGSLAAMGAAAGPSGYAMLIVGSRESSPPPYYYTWAEAQADGAGANAYDPGIPDLTKLEESITPRIALKTRMARRRIVAVLIHPDPLLIGHSAEVQLRREKVVCPRRVVSSCLWMQVGRRKRWRLVLGRASKISVPRLGAWERLTIRAHTQPFELEDQRYRSASASIMLR